MPSSSHGIILVHVWGVTPQNPEFIYKKLCIYSYMFKLQSPSKYSPFDVIHLWRLFFSLFKTVFEHINFDAFLCFCWFLFPPPHQQNVSLWGILSSKTNKQTKICWGEIRWIGRVGHRGHAILGQKLLNTQCTVGRWAHKPPIMRWANVLSLQKIHWSWKQTLTTMPAGTLIQMGA